MTWSDINPFCGEWTRFCVRNLNTTDNPRYDMANDIFFYVFSSLIMSKVASQATPVVFVIDEGGCSEFSASIDYSKWVIFMTGCASHNSSELSHHCQWGRGQHQVFIHDKLGYTRRHDVVRFQRWLYSFISRLLSHCSPLSETHLCMFCVQVSKSHICKGLRTWTEDWLDN